jgi:hypothetical protein
VQISAEDQSLSNNYGVVLGASTALGARSLINRSVTTDRLHRNSRHLLFFERIRHEAGETEARGCFAVLPGTRCGLWEEQSFIVGRTERLQCKSQRRATSFREFTGDARSYARTAATTSADCYSGRYGSNGDIATGAWLEDQ